jgi:Tfp pilus assembly protein PilX
MLNRRARHRSEKGQVLIMALAFIAFFGLITAAVLQLAGTVELQQSQTHSSAAAHADADAGILFAAEALTQTGTCTPAQATVPVSSGRSVAYVTTCTASRIEPCWEYEDVTVSDRSGVIGRARVLLDSCPGSSTTGIISIDYGS